MSSHKKVIFNSIVIMDSYAVLFNHFYLNKYRGPLSHFYRSKRLLNKKLENKRNRGIEISENNEKSVVNFVSSSDKDIFENFESELETKRGIITHPIHRQTTLASAVSKIKRKTLSKIQ